MMTLSKTTINNYDTVLIDSSEVDLDFKDIDFLLEREILIKTQGGKLRVNFVGEVITPNTKIISLPKNFEKNNYNIELTKKVLSVYRSLKKDGKSLIENRSFGIGGELTSDVTYFKKLKNFFFDHITYDFISPKKRISKHMSTPNISTIDIIKTDINSSIFGPGITYNLKDKSNSNWTGPSLSNIYYSTLRNLISEFGTSNDKDKFKYMEEYYKSKGHKFEYIDIDMDSVVSEIIGCQVGVIHTAIKNTLINYYKDKSINDKYKIRIFYSKNFEHVWEYFCRVTLKHNKKFKEKVEWVESSYKNSNPDVFSDFNGKMFIADCKYYNEINSDYIKEMYEYNTCQNNKYPILILLPSNDTSFFKTHKHREKELLIVKISLKSVIECVISGSETIIQEIYDIINSESNRKLDNTLI